MGGARWCVALSHFIARAYSCRFAEKETAAKEQEDQLESFDKKTAEKMKQIKSELNRRVQEVKSESAQNFKDLRQWAQNLRGPGVGAYNPYDQPQPHFDPVPPAAMVEYVPEPELDDPVEENARRLQKCALLQGCIRREVTSEAAPEAVRQAVGGGCLSGWGRLLSVANAIEAGACRQRDSGWA